MDIFLSSIVEGVWVLCPYPERTFVKKACLNASLVSAECFHNLLVKIVFHAFKRGKNMGGAPCHHKMQLDLALFHSATVFYCSVYYIHGQGLHC